MYFIYILQSLKDNGFYIGYSDNYHRRLIEHQNGEVDATKHRLPVKLIYLEGYSIQSRALDREKSLKDFGSAYHALLKRIGMQ